MAEKPILFSDKMVQAILSDTKTQTRRLVKPQPIDGAVPKPKFNVGDVLWVQEAWRVDAWIEDDGEICLDYESHNQIKRKWLSPPNDEFEDLWMESSFDAADALGNQDYFTWDAGQSRCRWRPNHTMPRWASRLQLEVTAIRMERLHDITEDDAEAEGMLECDGMFDDADYCRIAKEIGNAIGDLKPCFVQLWQSIYGPDSWSENPWVWVIEFKVAQVGEE